MERREYYLYKETSIALIKKEKKKKRQLGTITSLFVVKIGDV